MTGAVFMGTPAFAVPSLEAMASLDAIEIACVVTQPDRPAGRGQGLRPSPVKTRALELGLPVWTPDNLRGEESQSRLRELAPELLVVVAYGEILRREVLGIPPHGAINVHASLLPRHRGASPINAALLAGDEETGVTIMLMDEGMDTGPVLATRAIPILPHHTAGTLGEELSHLGARLLAETVPRWLAGELEPRQQPEGGATYTRLIHKVEGELDWTRAAHDLANQVRAYDPWPGTFTTWEGKQLKVLAAREANPSEWPEPPAPGTVARQGEQVTVATGDGWLLLETVQLEGRKAQPAATFIHGYPAFEGSRLGSRQQP
jgi:methionyl-tRNA formyltransferase